MAARNATAFQTVAGAIVRGYGVRRWGARSASSASYDAREWVKECRQEMLRQRWLHRRVAVRSESEIVFGKNEKQRVINVIIRDPLSSVAVSAATTNVFNIRIDLSPLEDRSICQLRTSVSTDVVNLYSSQPPIGPPCLNPRLGHRPSNGRRRLGRWKAKPVT